MSLVSAAELVKTIVRAAVETLLKRAGQDRARAGRAGSAGSRSRSRSGARSGSGSAGTRSSGAAASGYPGDYAGPIKLSYAPHEDGVPDPGEVVWTWVPYEEDYDKGKDRPVLIVGRDREWLLAVPMTSQDHDRDAAQEASEGRFWLDIGSGPWDSSGRASEVRVNRIVRVDPTAVRRISARLDRARFEAVAEAIRSHW